MDAANAAGAQFVDALSKVASTATRARAETAMLGQSLVKIVGVHHMVLTLWQQKA